MGYYAYIRIYSEDTSVLDEISRPLNVAIWDFAYVRRVVRHKNWLYFSLLEIEGAPLPPYFTNLCEIVKIYPSCLIVCDDWHCEETFTHGYYVIEWNSQLSSLQTQSIEWEGSDYHMRGEFNSEKKIIKEENPILNLEEKQKICAQLEISLSIGYYSWIELISEIYPISKVLEIFSIPEDCIRKIATYRDTSYIFIWTPTEPFSLCKMLLEKDICSSIDIDWFIEDHSLEGKWVHTKERGVDLQYRSRDDFLTQRLIFTDITEKVTRDLSLEETTTLITTLKQKVYS